MLPRILKNFNVIIDGHPMAGVAEEITLPSLERKMEDYRGGAMLGPVALDLGMDAIKLEFTLAQFDADALRLWGVWGASAFSVRFLGAAMSDDDTSGVTAIEITARGRWKKLDMGSVKGGDLAKMKIEMPCTWYRYSVNGAALIEIDMINMVEKVGGEDRSGAMARALGLSA